MRHCTYNRCTSPVNACITCLYVSWRDDAPRVGEAKVVSDLVLEDVEVGDEVSPAAAQHNILCHQQHFSLKQSQAASSLMTSMMCSSRLICVIRGAVHNF